MTRAILHRSDLRDQQHQITKLVAQQEAFLLVLPMGGGKTAAFLTAALDLLNQFEVRRVLIVAPMRVAMSVWKQEAAGWSHTRALDIAVACGTPKQRAAAVDRAAEITVINFENLVWLFGHVGGARKWPFDCVIVDESSMFKAGRKRTRTTKSKVVKVIPTEVAPRTPVYPPPTMPDASLLTARRGEGGETVEFKYLPDGGVRFRVSEPETLHLAWQRVRVTAGGNQTRFGVLCQARSRIKRLYELTGTPGDEHDLWGQIYLVDQGARLGSTMTTFEKRWFDRNVYSHEIKPLPGARDDIMSRITDVMISLPPPPNLPNPVFPEVRVDLPPKAIEEFVRFKRELYSRPHDVEAVSAGVLTNKLLQFANGAMYREDRSVAHIHDAKLDALDDLIARAAGDPLFVLYSFKFDLDSIRKRHPYAVVLNESPSFEADWNAGKIKLGVANPASCAHGLNLQFGGHLGVWFGLTWNLELYRQANARLARPGQKHQVSMYRIVANQTNDDRVLEVLDNGAATQDDMVKMALRDIRESCN